jgi:hypothetical protein
MPERKATAGIGSRNPYTRLKMLAKLLSTSSPSPSMTDTRYAQEFIFDSAGRVTC